MQLFQYQHQSSPVPSTGNVCPALWCRNMDPLGRWHEEAEAFHMRCQWEILDVRCWAHVSNAENIESMIVLYVCMFLRFGLSTIGVILHHRRLSLFGHVQGLGPWVPSHDVLRLMVDTYECRKPMASWRRPPGRPRNVWLSKVQRCANDRTYWCCGHLRSPGVAEQRSGPLGLLDDDDLWNSLAAELCDPTISLWQFRPALSKYVFLFERSQAPSH